MCEWSVNGLVYLFLMYLFFCKKKKKRHIVFIVFYFDNAKTCLPETREPRCFGGLTFLHTNEGQHAVSY